MRIVFMGTPQFAVPALDALVKSQHKVVGVVTVPDKPAGRGKKLRESDVKKYALEQGLTIFQPEKLKSDDIAEQLKALKPDVFVVVAFRMLPKSIWSIPKLGTFNLHASLLPKYRGAAPINWAIINGEEQTGITTFMIDEKIDTGEILLQKSIDITPEMNAGDLHDVLMNAGCDLILETIEGLESGALEPKPQNEALGVTMAPKLNKENTKIELSKGLIACHNLVRGLSPYPAAWIVLKIDDKPIRCKVHTTKYKLSTEQTLQPKLRIENKKLQIIFPEGILEIVDIQPEGKRSMKSEAFLNGLQGKSIELGI